MAPDATAPGRRRPSVTSGSPTRARPSPPARPAEALAAQFRERGAELHRDYLAAADRFEPEWAAAELDASGNLYLTPAELAELGAELMAVWQRYLDRVADPALRPAGSRLVHLSALGFPRADDLETTSSLETSPPKEHDDA